MSVEPRNWISLNRDRLIEELAGAGLCRSCAAFFTDGVAMLAEGRGEPDDDPAGLCQS
jgi:hypothetical protein